MTIAKWKEDTPTDPRKYMSTTCVTHEHETPAHKAHRGLRTRSQGELRASAEKSPPSWVRWWVLWEVDSAFFCGRLPTRASQARPSSSWAGCQTQSFAGGGSRPLDRSRPPPPKHDVWPRPPRSCR